MSDIPTIRYLNTDLDLTASVPLDSLALALKSLGVFPLHCELCEDGLWHGIFETETHDSTEPESDIAKMLAAIESLTDDLKRTWSACTQREFNVGYDCGDEPWAFNQGISNETLRRMAACGATLRLTLYPNRPDRQTECQLS